MIKLFFLFVSPPERATASSNGFPDEPRTTACMLCVSLSPFIAVARTVTTSLRVD